MIGRSKNYLSTMIFMLCLVSCGEVDQQEKEKEMYGKVPEETEQQDDSTDLAEYCQVQVSQEILEKVVIEVTYLENSVTELFKPDEGEMKIVRNSDGSEFVKISYQGVVETGEGWEKRFNLQLSAVVDSDNPPDFPYQWDYSHKQYSEPASQAERYAYNQTIMRIAIYYDPGESDLIYQSIYPNPVNADPENVVLTGYTRLLEGTSLSYDGSLNIVSESEIHEEDHAGMELNIGYSME